ncbi:PREDICTED: uncharacterized protein LOC109468917 [Branchiostoma belcheri]|uniref:Uncharacterized protein LOC109468917 n=1 Tax=Branchiostoma belcheri TaxID=7741 RepID=A0A6P4Y1P2_BRABE|nr:PREDICTED: uncharacterized protein LOC109468917 [Branchiostoma belcheri]
MAGPQVVLRLFVLLLSCTTNTTTFRAGKKFCSGKCIYDPFVVFGRCNGVDLQVDPTVSARNLFSGCVFCENIESENNGFPPCQLPLNIDILRFSDLQVSRLTGALFANLPKLRYLLVINGTVHSIEPGTFNNTPRLNTLTISGNKLSLLAPGRFNDLHSLENLRLDSNRIAQIEAGTFLNLTALSVLVLANNQLTRLEKDYFEGLSALEFIDLQHNKIEAIEPGTFKPFTYLMALLLSGNRLTVLAGGWSTGIENLRLRLSMSNNPFRCECLPSWIPEYLSIQSPVRQADGGAVCQFPPELKGEEITDALLHGLRPCPPPRVTVSAQNGSEQAFACEVLWEEESHISWRLPGSLVLTVHAPGRYEETSSRSHLENITTRVEHNVSLEGWTTPCEAPERSGSVYSYNATCGPNFAGKTTSVLVIGQSRAAQWNNQTVRCVASAPRDSFSMHDATASAVISVVEDPSLETLNTGKLQDTTWGTEVMMTASATTVVLSVLLDGPADSGTGYGGLYIVISVVCAAALAVLWGYLLVAKLCCGHTDDANAPQQGTGDGNEQQTADASDHEYATIKDEDCVSPRLDARPDNEYEEIRDDATSSAYLPHSPRASVHNKNSRKCNPHYSTKICENSPHGLYTIAENDGPEDGSMSSGTEAPSGEGDTENSSISGISAGGLSVDAGKSENGDTEGGLMSDTGEGPSGDGDTENSSISETSTETPSENGGADDTLNAERPFEDFGMSGKPTGPSGNGDAENALGAEGPSRDAGMSGNDGDGGAKGVPCTEGHAENDAAESTGRAEGLDGSGDTAEDVGVSGSADGPSGNGGAEDGIMSNSAEGPSGNDDTENTGSAEEPSRNDDDENTGTVQLPSEDGDAEDALGTEEPSENAGAEDTGTAEGHAENDDTEITGSA